MTGRPADPLAGARWTASPTAPGHVAGPADLEGAGLPVLDVRVPGTVGASVPRVEPDDTDWWYRTTVDVRAGQWWLEADGLATIADVWVDDRLVLHSESMWRSHLVDLGHLDGPTTITLRFAALGPLLATRRPRGRWRSQLVRQQHLRWFRTSIWGRMPSMPTIPAPVGPWRPLHLRPADRPAVVRKRLRAVPVGDGGRIEVEVDVIGVGDHQRLAARAAGVEAGAQLRSGRGGHPVTIRTAIELHQVDRWWPRTHGRPTLYPVDLLIDGRALPLGKVGFRTVEADRHDGGFTLKVNGEAVFARGAVWVGPDPVGLAPDPAEVTESLHRFAVTGCNLLRLAGTGVYEDEHFWSTCDELGILVWSDAAFANLDPPDDDGFAEVVAAEITEVWGRAGNHPSLAVACGGSEVEQQAAMLGLPPDAWVPRIQGEVVPRALDGLRLGIPYVTSSPTGGVRPFSPETGVAHWFGVGAYLRPLADATSAGVRFASECLAVSIPPEDDEHAWTGANRDAGAPWDFADVRDHYVRACFGVDPAAVRYADPERALDLGRAATVEMMTSTFATWRRAGSPCAGGVILSWRDVAPGAGWGLLDVDGGPKAPWWALRRILAPAAVWLVDDGLAGLRAAVANDLPGRLEGTLRVRLWGPDGTAHQPAERPVALGPRSTEEFDVEALLGGFRDVTWSYRFGPPSFDVVLAELLDGRGRVRSRSFALPLGPARPRIADVGLTAAASPAGDGWSLQVTTEQFAQYVRVVVDGFEPSDNWFHLEPGGTAELVLRPTADRQRPSGSVRALNSVASARIELTD